MTNDTASKWTLHNMSNLVAKMDLGKPKMVILMRESTHGISWYLNVNPGKFRRTDMKDHAPEENTVHAKKTLESIVLFL